MSVQSEEPTFILGVTMAGAVSAGAYNAGVFDFLIQALEEWERAREQDTSQASSERKVPNHRILVPVITGASAGGATAALGVFALSERTNLPAPEDAAKTRFVVPQLYQTWVESISFTTESRNHTLLGDTDLRQGKKVASLLDGSVLKSTAETIIRETKINAKPRPYLTDDLHLFLTVTNLRGIPYGIHFTGAGTSVAHMMSLHADRVHYCFNGIGSGKFTSNWLNLYGDTGVAVSAQFIQSTFTGSGNSHNKALVAHFISASLATGAFPVGLPAQHLSTHTSEYANRAWPYRSSKELGKITPAWPKNRDGLNAYDVTYVGVDGGVINNEPFEIARWTIMSEPGERNEPDATKCDRAVLLVDPFPQLGTFDPNLSEEDSLAMLCLRAILLALFPTLKNQARVKPIDLARSVNNKFVFSRFIIAPVRHVGSGSNERQAIDPLATGVLSAFGGFLSRKFPEHDYQLGRRNCQKFLREHFCILKTNAVVAGWPDECEKRHTIERDGDFYRVLIPLFGSANEEVTRPTWPRVEDQVVEQFIGAVKTRGNALVAKMAKTEFSSWMWSWIVRGVWRVHRTAILQRIRNILLADLIRRDQHARFSGLGSDLERTILACLFEMKESDCTPAKIERSVLRRNAANPLAPIPAPGKVSDILENTLKPFAERKNETTDVYILREAYRPPGRETVMARIKKLIRFN